MVGDVTDYGIWGVPAHNSGAPGPCTTVMDKNRRKAVRRDAYLVAALALEDFLRNSSPTYLYAGEEDAQELFDATIEQIADRLHRIGDTPG